MTYVFLFHVRTRYLPQSLHHHRHHHHLLLLPLGLHNRVVHMTFRYRGILVCCAPVDVQPVSKTISRWRVSGLSRSCHNTSSGSKSFVDITFLSHQLTGLKEIASTEAARLFIRGLPRRENCSPSLSIFLIHLNIEPTQFNHQPIAAFSLDISSHEVGAPAIHFLVYPPFTSSLIAFEIQPLAPVSSFPSVAYCPATLPFLNPCLDCFLAISLSSQDLTLRKHFCSPGPSETSCPYSENGNDHGYRDRHSYREPRRSSI